MKGYERQICGAPAYRFIIIARGFGRDCVDKRNRFAVAAGTTVAKLETLKSADGTVAK